MLYRRTIMQIEPSAGISSLLDLLLLLHISPLVKIVEQRTHKHVLYDNYHNQSSWIVTSANKQGSKRLEPHQQELNLKTNTTTKSVTRNKSTKRTKVRSRVTGIRKYLE
jgi:hypothetical protein